MNILDNEKNFRISAAKAKRWADMTDNNDHPRVEYEHYNKKRYRVAHLLEHGHKVENKYGTYGTTAGDNVIADAQDYAEEWLYDEVSKKLGG